MHKRAGYMRECGICISVRDICESAAYVECGMLDGVQAAMAAKAGKRRRDGRESAGYAYACGIDVRVRDMHKRAGYMRECSICRVRDAWRCTSSNGSKGGEAEAGWT